MRFNFLIICTQHNKDSNIKLFCRNYINYVESSKIYQIIKNLFSEFVHNSHNQKKCKLCIFSKKGVKDEK